MNEGLAEPRIEEPGSQEAVLEAPVETAAVPPSWLRLAYVFEFLIALVAIFTTWSQVGGQGHLDLLPWYIKLATSLGLAWSCVRFTSGLVEQPKPWNRRSGVWLAAMLVLAAVMAGITYYYHLHEVPDESDSEDTTATVVIQHIPNRICDQTRDRTSG